MRPSPLRLPVELFQQVSSWLDHPQQVRAMCEAFAPEHTGLDLYAQLMKGEKNSPAKLLRGIWETSPPAGVPATHNGTQTARLLNGVAGIAMKPPCLEDKPRAVPYNVADRGVRVGCFQRLALPELHELIDLVAERHLNEMAKAKPWSNGAWRPKPTYGTYIGAVALGASSDSVAGNLAEAFWSECEAASSLRRVPLRPLHVVHTLLGALMLEDLLRWCAQAVNPQDIDDRQRVTNEAMQALQSLSLERSYGSSLRQEGGRESSYLVAGSFSQLPYCINAFAQVKEFSRLYIDCPKLTELPAVCVSPETRTPWLLSVRPCPATAGKEVNTPVPGRRAKAEQPADDSLANEQHRAKQASEIYSLLLAKFQARERAWMILQKERWNLGGCGAAAFGELGEIAYNAVLEQGYAGNDELPRHRVGSFQVHGWQDPLIGPVHLQSFLFRLQYGSTSVSNYGKPNFFGSYHHDLYNREMLRPQPGTLRSLVYALDTQVDRAHADVAFVRDPARNTKKQGALAAPHGRSLRAALSFAQAWTPQWIQTGLRHRIDSFVPRATRGVEIYNAYLQRGNFGQPPTSNFLLPLMREEEGLEAAIQTLLSR